MKTHVVQSFSHADPHNTSGIHYHQLSMILSFLSHFETTEEKFVFYHEIHAFDVNSWISTLHSSSSSRRNSSIIITISQRRCQALQGEERSNEWVTMSHSLATAHVSTYWTRFAVSMYICRSALQKNPPSLMVLKALVFGDFTSDKSTSPKDLYLAHNLLLFVWCKFYCKCVYAYSIRMHVCVCSQTFVTLYWRASQRCCSWKSVAINAL